MLGDVIADVATVAAAAQCQEAGTKLVAHMRERLDSIRERAQHVRSRPRVACIEWLAPLMVAGNWVPELVEIGGGTYDLVPAGAHSKTITWDDLVAARPTRPGS